MSDDGQSKAARDRELGMNRDITRRDFLNGVSIAVGDRFSPLVRPGSTVSSTRLSLPKTTPATIRLP